MARPVKVNRAGRSKAGTGGTAGKAEVKEGRRIPGGATGLPAPAGRKGGGEQKAGGIRSPGMARRKKAAPVKARRDPDTPGSDGGARGRRTTPGASPPTPANAPARKKSAGRQAADRQAAGRMTPGRQAQGGKAGVEGKALRRTKTPGGKAATRGARKGRGKRSGKAPARRKGVLDRSGPPSRWRRGAGGRKGKKIPMGTRSPRFRLFVMVMIILIIVDIVFLVAVQMDWLGLDDGDGGAPRELDGIELIDGDHSMAGSPTPNVTHIFALRVTDGSLDLDEYEVEVSKVSLTYFEGVWYEANTTAGLVIRADEGGGGDTAQFTLSDDPYRDPYYPAESKRVEVRIFKDGVVVWFSRWDTPTGVLLE